MAKLRMLGNGYGKVRLKTTIEKTAGGIAIVGCRSLVHSPRPSNAHMNAEAIALERCTNRQGARARK